jgi:hypothetical protein
MSMNSREPNINIDLRELLELMMHRELVVQHPISMKLPARKITKLKRLISILILRTFQSLSLTRARPYVVLSVRLQEDLMNIVMKKDNMRKKKKLIDVETMLTTMMNMNDLIEDRHIQQEDRDLQIIFQKIMMMKSIQIMMNTNIEMNIGTKNQLRDVACTKRKCHHLRLELAD